jgi:hypothetical protein
MKTDVKPLSLIPNYQTILHQLQHPSSTYTIFNTLRMVNKEYAHTYVDVFLVVLYAMCCILYKNVYFFLYVRHPVVL